MENLWTYPPQVSYLPEQSLVGFTVETPSGTIGHVDRQVDRTGMRHLIVDTGVWVFGKSMLVPAGAVSAIDMEARTVKVTRTRDEIKEAPRFTTDSETSDPAYLAAVGRYYASLDDASLSA
ncbi:PRC-barrel domain containing protein [Streptomyces sp. NPDC088725]|uniref:PRC-barrel domain containing protein n=1 Tax=Streptomyces sp. NPDC088725 TaxID=3365873 RepID=UPI00380F5E3C